MPKTYWWSCTSCRKFWWIDNSRVHNTWRKLWISKKSPICFIGAKFWLLNGFNHIRATIQTSQEKEKSLPKFLEPTREPKVIYSDSSLACGVKQQYEAFLKEHAQTYTMLMKNEELQRMKAELKEMKTEAFQRMKIKKKRDRKNDRRDVCRP